MSAGVPNLESLFAAAVEIQSRVERAAFLDRACGDNSELREELERLLHSDSQAGSFLDDPSSVADATILVDESSDDRAASLDAGLATAMNSNEAIVIGHAGHSVLQSFSATCDVPRIALRQSPAESNEPIVRPKSGEMPTRNSDSRYRLDGEIARGGMGAILKGRDTDLGRELAIKVLLDQHKGKPDVIQRFIEEAQIGGQLQHPGIAPIYELGQFEDKRPFFAMKLVKGETLSKLLAERTEPSVDRGRFIGIFEQICQTMAYAHSRGVIHRDLKPSNIMVGAFGEVQVMDWGLAKVLPTGGIADEAKSHRIQNEQSVIQTLRTIGSETPLGAVGSQTQMGSVMGTPAYMPPEQALGEIDHLDERADVFGLGAILCEILTSKPPYVGEDGTQVFRMASRGKLADCFARLDNSGADPELVALAKQCLELEPQDRPRNAGVLAERVSRYIASVETKLHATETARAVQAERLEQQQRAAHKLQKMIAGLAAVSLFAIGTSIVAGKFWNDAESSRRSAEKSEFAATKEADRANQAEKEALRQRDTARDAQLDAQDQTYLATLNEIRAMRLARQAGWRSAAFEKIQRLAGMKSRNLDLATLRSEAIACIAEKALQLRSSLPAGCGGWHQAISPDGLTLAGSAGAQIDLVDLATKQKYPSIPKEFSLSPFAFHSGGAIARPLSAGRVAYHTFRPGQAALPDIIGEGHALNISFSGNGDRVAIIWGDIHSSRIEEGHPGRVREVTVHDSSTGQQVWRAELPQDTICAYKTALALSPDGESLATIGPGFEIQLFAVGSDQPPKTLGRLDNRICAIAFYPDGKSIVAAGMMVGAVWNLEQGRERFRFHSPAGEFWDVSVSPDGRLIGGVTNDLLVRLWDAQSGREVATAPTSTDHFTLSMAFSPKGDRMAVGGVTASLFDIEGSRECRRDGSVLNYVGGLAFDKQPGVLFASGGDNCARRLNLNGTSAQVVRTYVENPSVMKISPDGKHIANGFDGWSNVPYDQLPIRVWTMDDWETERSLEGPKRRVHDIAFDPTGRTIAATSADDALFVWDFATGRLLNRLNLPCTDIYFLDADRLAAISDNRLLIIGVADGTIQRELTLVQIPKKFVVTPDKRIAIVLDLAGVAHRVRLSDLTVENSSKVVDTVLNSRMAISPDGKLLVLATQAGPQSLLLDAITLQLVAQIPESDKRINQVTFDSTGSYLALGGAQVTLWDLNLIQVQLAHLGLGLQVGNSEDLFARFAETLRRTPDHATKVSILEFAKSVPGLLEKLAEQSNEDALFQVALSQHYLEQGKMELAEATRKIATRLARQQLAREPDNFVVAGQLVDMLRPLLKFVSLVPTSEETAVQWKYTTQMPDSSWTQPGFDDSKWDVGPAPFGNDHYPRKRSGWYSESIWLRHSFELKSSITADATFYVRVLCDDSAELLLNGKPLVHQSTFTAEKYLTLQLDLIPRDLLRQGTNTLAVIGRNPGLAGNFDAGLRILLDTSPTVAKMQFIATRLLDPWEKLAAMYFLAGEREALEELLARRPAAAVAVGQLCLVAEDWQAAIDSFSRVINADPKNTNALAARAAVYIKMKRPDLAVSDWRTIVTLDPKQMKKAADEFARAGLWNEAAEFALKTLEEKPNETITWLAVAPIVAQVDDQNAYTDFCDRLLQQFAESDSPYHAEQILKSGGLRISTAKKMHHLADRNDRFLESGSAPASFTPWAWGTQALFEYRTGNFEAAVESVQKSEAANPAFATHLLNLAVLSLAQHHLKQPEAARRTLDAATLVRAPFIAGERVGSIHDLLYAEIMYREARDLILSNANASPSQDRSTDLK